MVGGMRLQVPLIMPDTIWMCVCKYKKYPTGQVLDQVT